jgi:glycosyltransferase involved in cell wall biosynthesis
MKKEPLVSIVTATYNSASFIEECILSVKKQTHKNIEHIIIDGGSTDKTIEVIKKYENTYNLKWVSEKDGGLYDALNKGFKMATGEIFAWLDSDNLYEEDIIEKIVYVFKNNLNTDFVYGNVIIKNKDSFKIYKARKEFNFDDALFYNTGGIPVQPGSFFTKEMFEKISGFNIKYKIASDYDFWLKALKIKSRGYFLEESFGFYRVEDNALSQSLTGTKKGLVEMLAIGKANKQTLCGKLFLIKKYIIGYISIYIKRLFKKIKNVK